MDAQSLKTLVTGIGLFISCLGGIFVLAVTVATATAGAIDAADASPKKWLAWGAVKGAFSGFLLSTILVVLGLILVAAALKAT